MAGGRELEEPKLLGKVIKCLEAARNACLSFLESRPPISQHLDALLTIHRSDGL